MRIFGFIGPNSVGQNKLESIELLELTQLKFAESFPVKKYEFLRLLFSFLNFPISIVILFISNPGLGYWVVWLYFIEFADFFGANLPSIGLSLPDLVLVGGVQLLEDFNLTQISFDFIETLQFSILMKFLVLIIYLLFLWRIKFRDFLGIFLLNEFPCVLLKQLIDLLKKISLVSSDNLFDDFIQSWNWETKFIAI